jgi:hypothetical protein
MAEPGFTLVPFDEEAGPEEVLDAAERSALDDPLAIAEVKDPPIPFGQSWAFDHDRGRFIRSAGSPAVVRGTSALVEWVKASLRTAAGVHPILPPYVGIERPEDFLGSVDPTEALADFEDRAREALRAHDRIEDVRNFEAFVDLSQGVIIVTNLVIITDQEETLPLAPFNIEPEAA